MYSIIGYSLIGLSFLLSVFALISFSLMFKRGKAEWLNRGKIALWCASGLMFLALLLLIAAFLMDQFQLSYVASHSSQALPAHLKISALWAGQEGSLLLWAFLQVISTALVASRIRQENDQLGTMAVIILSMVTLFFTAMTLIFSNPFLALDSVPLDGQGMNPLLRHPAMVLHPPILYVGYVGLAVPFAYALASLIVGKIDDWPLRTRGWLLVSWITLGAGIILGARWAYDVLGWGGYWGWDPVENAALMPWLTATALLHGLSHQIRGKGFKAWNVSLASLTFLLVLFGTFTTRSGLIQSVHAFTRSPSGIYFLAFIILTSIFTVLTIFYYRKSFGPLIYPDAILSREGMAFFTLILLVLMTLSILAGTLLPTLTNGRFAAPPAWFNRVMGPQMGFLVFLMGICPLFGRYGRLVKNSKWLGILPLLGLIITPLTAYFSQLTGVYALLGFSFAGFAGGVALGEILSQITYQKNKNTAINTIRTLSITGRFGIGAQIVHFGIVLTALGVIGTQMFSFEQNFTISPGESIEIKDYILVYQDLYQETGTDNTETTAAFSLYKGTKGIGQLNPKIAYYPMYNQAIAEPDLKPGIAEDFYIVLFQWLPSGTVSINVMINPLSDFLWIGSIILLLGGILAWLPKKESNSEGSAQRSRILIVLVCILFFLMMIFAMWGNQINLSKGNARPLVGQIAPEFSGLDVNGSIYETGDCSNKVLILHFWATWCEQCEEELLLLNDLWQQTDLDKVCFIGVAMNDTQAAVANMISELGITFVMIPDPEGEISQKFGVRAVPETFVVDQEGVVTYIKIGVVDGEILAVEINSLMGNGR